MVHGAATWGGVLFSQVLRDPLSELNLNSYVIPHPELNLKCMDTTIM